MKEALDCQVGELADLRSHEEQARRDTNEAEQTASYYLDQLLRDSEEIATVKKERDELLWRESEAHE